MTVAHSEVRVAVAAAAAGGESPVWHPREQALYYVDIPAHRLHRHDPRSGESRHWDFATNLSCLAPKVDGRLLLGMRDGLFSFDPVSGERSCLAEPPYDPKTQRFNDGKCDPQGRFWVGTLFEPRTPPLAGLYCWDAARLTLRREGVTNLNGLAWSPNGRAMYWSDTTTSTIFVCDFDPSSGETARPRVFAQFPVKLPGQPLATYGGRPDGAAVDVEGCYWAAMFEGQRLVRLSPDGELMQELPLPVRCPTMPCFGGTDLRTLYITTAREKRPAEELVDQPWAGCVLAVDVDVAGLPVNMAAL